MAGLVVTWNGTLSSAFSGLYVNRVERGGMGRSRSVELAMPGRIGGWHFTEQRELRNIDVEFTLVASSAAARRDALDEVFDWLDVIGRKNLLFSDQTDRYWSAAIASIPGVDEAVRLGRFSASFTAEPYALAVSTASVCATGATGASNSGSFNMPGAVAVDPEVTIAPSGGNLTGISFTLNGDEITWAGEIAAGETLTISSISSTVLTAASGDAQLLGAFDEADLDMQSVEGTFGRLTPGSNAWAYDGGTGGYTSLDICFNYRRRYH